MTARRRKGHQRAARFARRPLVMFFLLSLQCHAQEGQVRSHVVKLGTVSVLVPVKLRCHGQCGQVRVPVVKLRYGRCITLISLRHVLVGAEALDVCACFRPFRGPVLIDFRPFESFRTSKIDSGGPDRSLCTKRELASLSETHFAIIFVRSAKDSRFFAISSFRI